MNQGDIDDLLKKLGLDWFFLAFSCRLRRLFKFLKRVFLSPAEKIRVRVFAGCWPSSARSNQLRRG
jgi:hypothetical protein